MKIKSTRSRGLKVSVVLLLVTLMAGCYDGGGWGEGYPGGWGGYGSGYSNNYYSDYGYRGYGSYAEPGLFGGYAPAHEAWDAGIRGRSSYGHGYVGGGEHGFGGGHGGGFGGGHGGGGHGR